MNQPHLPTRLESIKTDLSASVVVFLVALPLCLGIALASGAPITGGIIAGIIGGVVIGALSGSPLSVSGPAAGLVIVCLQGINQLGSYEFFLVAVVLAGIFQLVFGFLKLGIIGEYVPTAVVKGMLAGIGLVIILKEIPHALGRDKDFLGRSKIFSRRRSRELVLCDYSCRKFDRFSRKLNRIFISANFVWLRKVFTR